MTFTCNRIGMNHRFGTTDCPVCHPTIKTETTLSAVEPCPRCGEIHEPYCCRERTE